MNYRTYFICWQSGKVKQKSLIFQQGSHRNALSSPNPNLVQRTVGQQHLGTGWVTLPGHMCIVMKDMAPRTDFPGYPRAPALARWGKHLFCLLNCHLCSKVFPIPGHPGCVPGAGCVTLLPPVGANLLHSWDAAPLAASRCHAQISSAAESQL